MLVCCVYIVMIYLVLILILVVVFTTIPAVNTNVFRWSMLLKTGYKFYVILFQIMIINA